MDTNFLAELDKTAKVLAIFVGGAWIYLNTIRGRTFIPRLQPTISGSLVKNGMHHFVLVDVQVKNVGSSIASIKEKGTGLKLTSLRCLGGADGATDLLSEEESAFSVFGLADGEVIEIEPRTVLYGQELIEVPPDSHNAFRLELRISALRGSFNRVNRKWRAFAIVVSDGSPHNANTGE